MVSSQINREEEAKSNAIQEVYLRGEQGASTESCNFFSAFLWELSRQDYLLFSSCLSVASRASGVGKTDRRRAAVSILACVFGRREKAVRPPLNEEQRERGLPPCANSYIAGRLKPAPGRVGSLCQLLEDGKELRRLADE